MYNDIGIVILFQVFKFLVKLRLGNKINMLKKLLLHKSVLSSN